jgi:serine/threonine protein phosphatase PrpC
MSASPAPTRVVVRAYGVTDTGQRRKNNEDAFIIADLARLSEEQVRDREITLDASDHAVLLAVSDGMGGANAGEVASALVVDSLRRAMQEAEGDWDEVTRLAVERANREVFAAAADPSHKGMGATLTAVCVHATHAHVAVVGDSRAYLLRGGTIRQMTKDQSFVQYLVDLGALAPSAADGSAVKNVVLQAMGQKADVAVALGRLELRRGDRLLLCSDGLSNKVSADDMRAVVERAPTLPGACWELVELANARGGDDNITVVLAEVTGEAIMVADEAASLTRTFQVLSEYKAHAADLGLPDEDEDEDLDAPPPIRLLGSPSEAPAAAAPARAATAAPARAGRGWLLPALVALLALIGAVSIALASR